MTTRLLLLAVVCLPVSAFAGQDDSPPEVPAARIKSAVAYPASDRLEGRGPGTRGEFLATEHIANGFKDAGLKPSGVAPSLESPDNKSNGRESAGATRPDGRRGAETVR